MTGAKTTKRKWLMAISALPVFCVAMVYGLQVVCACEPQPPCNKFANESSLRGDELQSAINACDAAYASWQQDTPALMKELSKTRAFKNVLGFKYP